MVRTGLGGSIPGYDPSDQGGGSDDTVDDGGGSPDPADEFGSELGGDPVDSGGSSSPNPPPAPDPEPDPGTGGSSNQTARSPQRGPTGGPNQRQSGGGSLTDQGLGQADALNQQVPDGRSSSSDSGGSSGSGSSGDANRPRDDLPDVGVGSGPAPDDFDTITESNLRDQAAGFRENVAEPVGSAVRRSSPATELDRALPGEPVGRSVENFTEGVVGLANVPGAAAGAISAFDRAARDTRRANEEGAAGRRQNRRELASDATTAAARTGRAIQNDPVGTLSQLAGSAVGGAFVGGAASRALRGAPDTGSASGSGSVPSGRADVGTGGRGSILEDVDVDAERGITGPSTGSRVRGEVSRAVDDATARLGDSRVGDFVEDTRAQLQQPRGTRDTDFSDAPDRTRPADAGGTFEDVRQDALTQLQDDLSGRGRRPDPGTFDGAPQPFRSGGGDTIDADGVKLQRTSGTPEIDTGLADEVGTGSTTAGRGSGGATGTVAGLGTLSPVNDPTGIADTSSATAGTVLDPVNDPTGITGTAAGTEDTGGVLDPANDPTGITGGGGEGLTDPLGGGTSVGGVSDTDTGSGTDTGPLGDVGTPPVTGTEPVTAPFADTPTDTDVGVDTDAPPVTDVLADTATVTDVPGLSGTTPPGLIGSPTTPPGRRGGGGGRGGGFGGGFGGGTGRRTNIDTGSAESEDEEEPWWIDEDADTLDSGIASGAEQLEEIGAGFGSEEDSFL